MSIIKKYFCIDCRKEVSRSSAKRCRSCATKELWTRNSWRDKVQSKISNTLMGHTMKQDIRDKISMTLKEATKNGTHFIPVLRGAEHYNWQGGKSLEEYGREFNNGLKKKIRDRDLRLCRMCGICEDSLNEQLVVHHKDHNKRNNSENNLISLCRGCHMKLHHMMHRLSTTWV